MHCIIGNFEKGKKMNKLLVKSRYFFVCKMLWKFCLRTWNCLNIYHSNQSRLFFKNKECLEKKAWKFAKPRNENLYYRDCTIVNESVIYIYYNSFKYNSFMNCHLHIYNLCYRPNDYFSWNHFGWSKSHRRIDPGMNTNI